MNPLPRHLLALCCALTPIIASARTWTAADGRTIEAEFVGATADEVKVKRDDGRTFTIPLNRLSEEDREWVREQAEAAPAEEPKAIEGEYASLVTGDWALSTHGKLPFAFYGAKSLSADNKYPLVVALHGKSENNENGRQIHGWMKVFTNPQNYADRPCFILAPLCYQPYGGTGGGWRDSPGDETVDLIGELLEALPIDEDRVYVIGHSMGGFGTCHLMAKEKRLFAAGIPVSGYGSGGEAGDLKRKPLWLFHAADDDVVGVEGARNFAESLKRSDTFTYTEFPTGGHGVIGRVFDDPKVHEWLFEQKK